MRYSPSRIKTYDGCHLQFKLRYLDEIEIEKKIRDDAQFGSFVHKFAELYNGSNAKEILPELKEFNFNGEFKSVATQTLKNFMAFHEKYKKYEYETEREYEFKNDKVHMHGIIDRVMKIDKEKIIFVDYKTAKYPNRDNHIFQMKFYNLMVARHLGLEPGNVRCLIYYPRIDTEDKFVFMTPEADNFENYLHHKMVEIESRTEWNATPGSACRFCDFNGTKYCSKGKKFDR